MFSLKQWIEAALIREIMGEEGTPMYDVRARANSLIWNWEERRWPLVYRRIVTKAVSYSRTTRFDRLDSGDPSVFLAERHRPLGDLQDKVEEELKMADGMASYAAALGQVALFKRFVSAHNARFAVRSICKLAQEGTKLIMLKHLAERHLVSDYFDAIMVVVERGTPSMIKFALDAWYVSYTHVNAKVHLLGPCLMRSEDVREVEVMLTARGEVKSENTFRVAIIEGAYDIVMELGFANRSYLDASCLHLAAIRSLEMLELVESIARRWHSFGMCAQLRAVEGALISGDDERIWHALSAVDDVKAMRPQYYKDTVAQQACRLGKVWVVKYLHEIAKVHPEPCDLASAVMYKVDGTVDFYLGKIGKGAEYLLECHIECSTGNLDLIRRVVDAGWCVCRKSVESAICSALKHKPPLLEHAEYMAGLLADKNEEIADSLKQKRIEKGGVTGKVKKRTFRITVDSAMICVNAGISAANAVFDHFGVDPRDVDMDTYPHTYLDDSALTKFLHEKGCKFPKQRIYFGFQPGSHSLSALCWTGRRRNS